MDGVILLEWLCPSDAGFGFCFKECCITEDFKSNRQRMETSLAFSSAKYF
jgi:hypothetical protein